MGWVRVRVMGMDMGMGVEFGGESEGMDKGR